MIEIKGYFGDWKAVEKDYAQMYVYHMMQGITTTNNTAKKAAMIDGKHLRGITVEELFADVNAGRFVYSGGGENFFVGIDYVSPSVGCTVWCRNNTDLGLRDRDEMMERIGRMSNFDKAALILR